MPVHTFCAPGTRPLNKVVFWVHWALGPGHDMNPSLGKNHLFLIMRGFEAAIHLPLRLSPHVIRPHFVKFPHDLPLMQFMVLFRRSVFLRFEPDTSASLSKTQPCTQAASELSTPAGTDETLDSCIHNQCGDTAQERIREIRPPFNCKQA